MKKNLLSIFIALCAFAGCTDDAVLDEQLNQPAQTGDEVQFGVPTLEKVENETSRTVYGQEKLNVFPINWVNNDQIAIYCPEAAAPADKMVWYNVGINQGSPTPNVADYLTKVGAGTALQWGASETHNFYAFYPGEKVSKKNLSQDDAKDLIAEIPTNQIPTAFVRRDAAGNYGSMSDKNKKFIIAQPDMTNALMYAYNQQAKSTATSVKLHFKPIVTALMITVNGPSEGEVAISKIVVSSHPKTDGGEAVPIAGKFRVHVDTTPGDNNGKLTCTTESQGVVDNLITIPCTYTEGEETNFVTLKPGEQLKAVAFIAPDDIAGLSSANIKVRVTPMNKTPKSKMFGGEQVTVRKITKVNLPNITAGEDNQWMKNLDDNIYLTELSLPGSKLSYATNANGAPIEYQTSTLKEQFDAGVRAFILQTGAVHQTKIVKRKNPNYDPKRPITTRPEFFEEEVDDSYLAVAIDSKDGGVKRIKPLKKAMDDLTALVKDTREYVFVLLTYSGGATDAGPNKNQNQFWAQTLEKELNFYKSAESTASVYKDRVTPHTTLAGVRGKILLKANYNDNVMKQAFVGTEMPCMFTLWERGYEPDGISMQWGSPKNTSDLTWLYQERTDITDFTEKETSIKYIFTKSVETYNQSVSHDTWFMNDLGGYDARNGGTMSTLDVATHFNGFAVNELQTRTQNAALGLLYMNFVDTQVGYGKACKSDWLIQTTIDNNFKFPLRVAPGTSPASYSTGKSRAASVDEWDE